MSLIRVIISSVGLFSVRIVVLLYMSFQFFMARKCYMSFQGNNVLKLLNQMSVKGHGSQTKGLELVNKRGHMIFTPLALFGGDLGINMVKTVKRVKNLIEATNSHILKLIDSNNL